MKAGIVTIHNAINYGATLQAYALQTALKDLGIQPSVIDYRNIFIERNYNAKYDFKNALKAVMHLHIRSTLSDFSAYLKDDKIHKYKKIRKSYFKFAKKEMNCTRPVYSIDDSIFSEFDAVICGSDQIWNDAVVGLLDDVYFLNTDKIKKKISYAASGKLPYGEESHNKRFSELLQSFSAVSVREKSLMDYINSRGISESCLVCDPTMLLTAEKWDEIIPERKIKEPYIFAYLMWEEPGISEYIKKLEAETGMKAIILNRASGFSLYKGKKIQTGSPYCFLSLLKNADYVVANSFHGTVFSILFHKSFVAVNSGERISNLLGGLNISDRTIERDGKANCDIKEEINWKSVDKAMEDIRKSSKDFLINALAEKEKV